MAKSTKGAVFALTLLTGYLAWQNRFALQRRLESLGIKTPLLPGSVDELARSVASKASGKMEHGATIAENIITRKTGT